MSIALPASSYSSSTSVFLQEFTILLSTATTIPHEFLITEDFDIHVDNPSDSFAWEFLKILSSTNLAQHVNFPSSVTTTGMGSNLIDVIEIT